MTLSLKECSIEEIEGFPNFADILEEYAAESSISGLPHPSAKMDMYRQLVAVGALHVICAFKDETFIGFITVLTSIIPHYSTTVATTESFFVAKEYRSTGAGMKLLREAEAHAKEKGVRGILVSAPINGVLAEVLPHTGYTETNRVFFRRFSYE